MSHPPFPRGATGPEVQAIERLHRVADRHREPEVRTALSEALSLIIELIEGRMARRGFDADCDSPQDGG